MWHKGCFQLIVILIILKYKLVEYNFNIIIITIFTWGVLISNFRHPKGPLALPMLLLASVAADSRTVEKVDFRCIYFGWVPPCAVITPLRVVLCHAYNAGGSQKSVVLLGLDPLSASRIATVSSSLSYSAQSGGTAGSSTIISLLAKKTLCTGIIR